jgi:hypothetical protein
LRYKVKKKTEQIEHENELEKLDMKKANEIAL